MDYEECPYEAEVNVILTDNPAIQEINREHRQIDAPTDVLSFPMVDYERTILLRRQGSLCWVIL